MAVPDWTPSPSPKIFVRDRTVLVSGPAKMAQDQTRPNFPNTSGQRVQHKEGSEASNKMERTMSSNEAEFTMMLISN